MKIWCTRYALSQGIVELDAQTTGVPGMLKAGEVYLHKEGKDWHRTKAEARFRAESLRTAKILRLMKQIQQLKELKF